MYPSFFLANCSFTHFWANNEGFTPKTDEQIPSPDKESFREPTQKACEIYNIFLFKTIKKTLTQ